MKTRKIGAAATITLTTDFGLRDWFVGTLKGVILRIHSQAAVVDITHEVRPGDIQAAGFALAAAFRFFPRRTVHLAIVDPGVGSPRPAIAVKTKNYCFVAPDNGVLSLALATEQIQCICRLENEAFFVNPISHTFHGRDIFAPVAAHLSRGVPIRKFGPHVTDYCRLPLAPVEEASGKCTGSVVYIDRFGNAITNLARARQIFAGRDKNRTLMVHVAGQGQKLKLPIVEFYQAVQPGVPMALFGSSDFLEIAVNGGAASEQLALTIGTVVTVRSTNSPRTRTARQVL